MKAPTNLHKVTVTVTILTEADSAGAAMRRFSNMELSEIADQIDTGDNIGIVDVDVEPVPSAKVKPELLRMGNDGTFFGELGPERASPQKRTVPVPGRNSN